MDGKSPVDENGHGTSVAGDMRYMGILINVLVIRNLTLPAGYFRHEFLTRTGNIAIKNYWNLNF